jgi:predicted secreted protein
MSIAKDKNGNFLCAIKFIAIQALIVLASVAYAQNIQDTTRFREPLNVIQLSASAAVEVQQDVLTISMSTTREAADANVVQTQLKTALDTALAEAKKASSPGQLDVRTGNFSLYPRHTREGKINGWQGTTELVLEGRDFAKISALAGKIQTLTVANVAFSLSREQRTKVEAEAQSQAIERFRAKAADISKSFGMSSYTLREVAVNAGDQGFVPRPRGMQLEMKMSSADAAVPVEAGKSTVTVTVSGTVQLR